jgi:hypothetical protein
MVILPAGVHSIAADAYHADPAPVPSLSSSIARVLLNQSPRHAWHASPRLNPDWEPTERKTFDIGRAAHRLVLGAGSDFEVIPSDLLAANGAASTKEAKAFIEDCRARGVTPLKEAEADAVQLMAAAVTDRLDAMRIKLDPARSELAALAQVDGIWCRAMVDNAPADPRLPLYDFKTTTDASPEAVVRAVEAYGYDVQAAHYLDTWQAATGERRRFRFVFVEKEAPHEVSVVELHDAQDDPADWMATARSKAREARRIWGECLAADEWPGYPARVAVIGARSFHNQRWADRETGMPVTTKKPTADALRAASQFMAPEGMGQ